jgi:hypothetical protein
LKEAFYAKNHHRHGSRHVVHDSSASSKPTSAERARKPGHQLTRSNNANNPVAGANSFTEGQAKSRIEANGYANVSDLKKDDQGVWRGKAQKDGKTVEVSMDFQGNIIAR